MLLGRVSGRPGDRSLQYSSLLEVLSEVGMIQTFYDRRLASGWTFTSSTLPNFANGTSGYLWTSERCFGQIPCPLGMSYIAGMSHTWAIHCFKFRCFPSNKCPQRQQGGSSALHVASRFVSFPTYLGIFQGPSDGFLIWDTLMAPCFYLYIRISTHHLQAPTNDTLSPRPDFLPMALLRHPSNRWEYQWRPSSWKESNSLVEMDALGWHKRSHQSSWNMVIGRLIHPSQNSYEL